MEPRRRILCALFYPTVRVRFPELDHVELCPIRLRQERHRPPPAETATGRHPWKSRLSLAKANALPRNQNKIGFRRVSSERHCRFSECPPDPMGRRCRISSRQARIWKLPHCRTRRLAGATYGHGAVLCAAPVENCQRHCSALYSARNPPV